MNARLKKKLISNIEQGIMNKEVKKEKIMTNVK
jgi:hypothetical protein